MGKGITTPDIFHWELQDILRILPGNQVHSSVIRQWLRAGDVNRLEQLVLEGQGHKLVGEYSPDPRVRSLLKQIPAFLVKTKKLHEVTVKGDLKQLQKLLSSVKSNESPMKNIHMSKNQSGLSLLHKAVYYGHTHIVEFLLSNFPESVKMKDNEGKTPLHYCGASKEAGKIWPILMKAGADPNLEDSQGKRPVYYMERSNEIQLPEEKILSGISVTSTSDKNNFVIKPSNIRIWIHDRDLRKLQQVIWEGHGAKLRVETSKHPKVKRFLEGVPYILNIIKDVHSSVVEDKFEEFVKKTSDPIPKEILKCKDENGLTPLHKAAGLNRRKIAENILQRSPNLAFSVDREGKTPLHYAAALKDNGAMYNLFKRSFSDETTVDKNGKTALYYKANPKEINTKILESIPNAPRTSVAFPQAFDWSLFHGDGVMQSGNSYKAINSFSKAVENHNYDESKSPATESELDDRKELNGDLESNQSEVKSSVTESVQVDEQTEPEESKNYDIWTNEEEEEKQDTVPPVNDELNDGRPEDVNKREEEESVDNEYEKGFNGSTEREENGYARKEPISSPVPGYEEPLEEQATRERTEREIAEERQRLLDEGLLRINSEETEADNESRKVDEAIEAGDMEKLAAMVLSGEGDKLKGKTSNNSELQNFLDNVPIYMAKITEVHKAARNGSLKDLQAALDRRKFAVAKESSDKSGSTPLHAAVLYENDAIIQYLGGRFPETLQSRDKVGRTPLHYAATLNDGGHIFNTLLDLGADPNVKDEVGHTATFYQNTPGELTQEKLLQEINLSPRANEQSNPKGVSSPVTDPSVHNIEPEISFDEGIPVSRGRGNDEAEEDSDGNGQQSNFSITDRDEYGQSILHFAAARAHGRGGLFQLIHESGVNLGCKDELYRTARDIAHQADLPENINEIDKYVISLAAKGETGKLVELFLEGYDHIIDLHDENNSIMTIAENKDQEKTLAFLKTVPGLQEKREKVHSAVREGDCKQIENILSNSKNGRFLVIGKNSYGRCSLHIAVLCQQKEVTEFIAQKYPETLRIGDNLERTPLHCAMGVEEVETLSTILIKCGAKRVVKDLKGRQPTYYFMNKTDILKLQEEENLFRV